MRFARRIEKLPPYLFAEISRKVAEKRAQGVDVISFGIGDLAAVLGEQEGRQLLDPAGETHRA